MAASGTTTPERDARRGVQCLNRQYDSALGDDRGRRRRADVCDSSTSALAPAIVGIRGGCLAEASVAFALEGAVVNADMNCAFKAARPWRKVRLRLLATSAAAQKRGSPYR
jgi:hypothetical protein